MNDGLLKLYHCLPSPARSIAASLRGYYLSVWRYDQETDDLVEAALKREQWNLRQWKTWQEEQLAYILHRSATRVPYYRELWTAGRRKGERTSWERLENWPVLEKESVRENPRAFLADDSNIREMFHEHTSGTSGKSLDLWWSRATVRTWYALFEARCRNWYGVSRHDRWAMLGGQLVTPARRRRAPFWVWNVGLNQLYMSSYHLAPDLISHYLNALGRYRVTYLFGYSSSLYALAQEVLRQKRCDLQMKVVITNAEPLFEYQREAIAEAFQCPVRETYGMAEIVAAASECQLGQLHQWPEVGVVEVEDNCGAVQGLTGDLTCTGLLNSDMPLIRYRVGDRGMVPAINDPCECGRTLPVISSIEGRVDDVLYTSDGRQVGRLDPIFKDRLPIREAQIIQETLDSVRVRFVPAPGYSAASGQSIIDRLRERMGPIEVILEEVDCIPRTINGKFRAVICNLQPEDRQKSSSLY